MFALEKVRRRIRVCLLLVVLTAAAVGLVYYFYDVRGVGSVADGTLIAILQNGWGGLIGHGVR